jgi:hypothetical protein
MKFNQKGEHLTVFKPEEPEKRFHQPFKKYEARPDQFWEIQLSRTDGNDRYENEDKSREQCPEYDNYRYLPDENHHLVPGNKIKVHW